MEFLAKITSKGQITIPKKIREILKGEVVRFRVLNGKVILESVKDVGGSLKKYANKKFTYEQEREIAWKRREEKYGDIS